MAKGCIERAVEALGFTGDKALTKEELRAVKDRLGKLEKYVEDSWRVPKVLASDDPLLQQRIKETLEQLQIEAKINIANTYRNLNSRMRAADKIVSIWKDKPEEGLKALIFGSYDDRVGSKNSLGARVAGRRARGLQMFISKVEDSDLWDVAIDPKNDRELFRALRLLNEDPSSPKLADIDPRVKKLADTYHEFQQKMLSEANENGAWRGTNDTFIFGRYHDQDSITFAAGRGYGASAKENSDAWVKYMLDSLDLEKTFPHTSLDDVKEILIRAHSSHTSGKHWYSRTIANREKAGIKPGYGNIAAKLSARRVYHFKNADLDFEYHQRFGGGKSAFEVMLHSISTHARDVEIMRVMGPNARANFDMLVNDLGRLYGDESGGGVVAGRINTEAKWINDYIWPQLTGENGGRQYNADHWVARSFQWMPVIGERLSKSVREGRFWDDFRSYFHLSLLGSAGVSTLADAPAMGRTLSMYTDGDIKAFSVGVKKHWSNFIEAFTRDAFHEYGPESLGATGSGFDAFQKRMFADLAISSHVRSDPMGLMDMSPETLLSPGSLSTITQKFLRATRIIAVSERDKFDITTTISGGLANRKHMPFEDLERGYKQFLNDADITPSEWDFIRSEALVADAGGQEFITVRTAENLSDHTMMDHPTVTAFRDKLLEADKVYSENLKKFKEREIEWRAKKENKILKSMKKAEDLFEKRKKTAGYRPPGAGLEDKALNRILQNEELLKARMEQVEAETALRAWFDQEELREGMNEAIEGALYDQKKGPAQTEAYRLLKKQGRTQARLGQQLGDRRAKAKIKVKELEKSLMKLGKETAEKIGKADKAYIQRIQKLGDELSGWVGRSEERIKFQEDRLNEFKSKIADRVLKEGARVRDDMASRLGGIFHEVAGMATNEPDLAGRAYAHGAILGLPVTNNPLLKMVMMYKGFAVSLTRKHLVPMMLNVNKKGFSKGTVAPLAGFLAVSAFHGWLTWSLKELSKGNTPPLPTDVNSFWKMLIRSAATSGSLGIYGDVALQDTSNYGRDLMSNLIGPAGGLANDAASLYSSLFMDPDIPESRKKAARMVVRNLPGQNFWATRGVLDALLRQHVEEFVSPGSNKRKQERMWKEFRQVSVFDAVKN